MKQKITEGKVVDQSKQRTVEMGNEPRPFAPNDPIMFDQQNAQALAQERVSNAGGSSPFAPKPDHYKESTPTLSDPIAK